MSPLLARLLAFLTLVVLLAGCAPARSPSDHIDTRAPARPAADTASVPTQAGHAYTYVAIGASDTFGYGVPDPATQGWVPRFATHLPTGTRVVNLGVVGITLHHALLVDLPVALDAHPDLVTVWLAVNDLLGGVPLESYRADLHTLLAQLRATGARVLVGNLPDLALVPAASSRLGPDRAGTIAAWNAAITAVAQDTGATLVDLYGSWQELAAHPEYIGPDGLHPSIAGYDRLAQIFAAALQ